MSNLVKLDTIERNEHGFIESNLIVATTQPSVSKTDSEGNVSEVDKNKKERVVTGAIPYAYPTPNNVLEGMPAPDSYTSETITTPTGDVAVINAVYNDPKLQFLANALRSSMEQPIRSGKTIITDEFGRFKDMTITKDKVIDWPSILEVSSSGGEYMRLRTAIVNLFKVWLEEKGVKTGQVVDLVKAFRNPDQIPAMNQSLKGGITKALAAFEAEYELDDYVQHTSKIHAALAVKVEAASFDDMEF